MRRTKQDRETIGIALMIRGFFFVDPEIRQLMIGDEEYRQWLIAQTTWRAILNTKLWTKAELAELKGTYEHDRSRD